MENSISYQRRCAVSKAWSKERKQVLQSRGSRNWSQKEQREIIATGKCHGYEGQHMLSVKSHPEHAGNEKNIQFLTHEEHFQAHGGNRKNDANGRFNLKTKKLIHSMGNYQELIIENFQIRSVTDQRRLQTQNTKKVKQFQRLAQMQKEQNNPNDLGYR